MCLRWVDQREYDLTELLVRLQHLPPEILMEIVDAWPPHPLPAPDVIRLE